MFHHKPLSRPFSPYIREARGGPQPSLSFSTLPFTLPLFSSLPLCVRYRESKGRKSIFSPGAFSLFSGTEKGGEGHHQNRKRGKKEVAFSPPPPRLFGQNVRSTCEDALSGKEGHYWGAKGRNSSAPSFSTSDWPIFSYWLARCIEHIVPISAVGTAIQGDECPHQCDFSIP